MVRWWWPGGDVNDEEISRELRIIKDAGLGGVEIQSFKDGLNPAPTAEVARRVDSFLTPEWFKHVKYAIEEGGRLGLDVDLTFGSGWPFGGPYIPLSLAAQKLLVHEISYHRPHDILRSISRGATWHRGKARGGARSARIFAGPWQAKTAGVF